MKKKWKEYLLWGRTLGLDLMKEQLLKDVSINQQFM